MADQPLYEYGGAGIWFRVWPNRVEQSASTLGDQRTETILIRNITSVEAHKPFFGVPKLRIVTNDGKRREFVVPDPRKARDAILSNL